jgi:hypothetical protein
VLFFILSFMPASGRKFRTNPLSLQTPQGHFFILLGILWLSIAVAILVKLSVLHLSNPLPSTSLSTCPVLWPLIYNQAMESAYMSINWWMDKESMVHMHTGVFFSHKTEWNYVVCRKMTRTGDHNVKWNKANWER